MCVQALRGHLDKQIKIVIGGEPASGGALAERAPNSS